MIFYLKPSQCDTTMVSFESHYKKKKNILRRKWGSRIHGRTTKGCIIKIKRETTGRLLSVSSSMIVFLLIYCFEEECTTNGVSLNTIPFIIYKKKKKLVFKYHRVYGISKKMDYIISSSRHYKIMPCVVLFCKISVIICYCEFVRSLKKLLLYGCCVF